MTVNRLPYALGLHSEKMSMENSNIIKNQHI